MCIRQKISILSNEDKATGALLGAAYGDALGWPNERRDLNSYATNYVGDKTALHSWNRKKYFKKYGIHYEDVIDAGSYSDDTQLIMCLCRSLLKEDLWFKYYVNTELPFWTLYENGGGYSTKLSIKAWSSGVAPWSKENLTNNVRKYFSAGGNGVAMRILPHLILGRKWDFADIANRIFLDGITTHGHPQALVGAIVYAYALHILIQNNNLDISQSIRDVNANDSQPSSINGNEQRRMNLIEILLCDIDKWSILPESCYAFNGHWLIQANKYCDYHSLWNQAVDDMISYLHIIKDALQYEAFDKTTVLKILTDLNCFNKSIKGAGTVTAAAAIYIASLYKDNPLEGIVTVAFADGADTDTIACMAGGLLGCVHGVQWLLPVIKTIQDADCLKSYASSLVSLSESYKYNSLCQDNILADLKPVDHQLKTWKADILAYHKCEAVVTSDKVMKDNLTLFDGRAAKAIYYAFPYNKGKTNAIIVKCTLIAKDGQSINISDCSINKGNSDSMPLMQSLYDHNRPLEAQADTKNNNCNTFQDQNLLPTMSPCSCAGVKVVASSLNVSLRFYSDCFGLTVKKQNKSTISFDQGIVLVNANYLDYLSIPSDGNQLRTIIYIESSDIYESYNRVEKMGFKVIKNLSAWKKTKIMNFACLDPDNNIVEVFESKR